MSQRRAIHLLRIGLGLSAASVWLGCGTPGIEFATGPGSTAPDGLQRVRWSELGTEFLKPGADLRAFTQILVDPVTISYQTQHGQGLDPRVSPHTPEPRQLDAIQRIYKESFQRRLAGGSFRPATAPGPGVLRVSGHIVDLTVLAPPSDELDPDETVYTTNAGDLTLVLDVSDAQTGAALLRSAGRHPVSLDPVIGGGEDDPVANAAALSELFDQQALLLRQRLQQLRTTPAPAAP
jgi:hypothetical protein